MVEALFSLTAVGVIGGLVREASSVEASQHCMCYLVISQGLIGILSQIVCGT